MHPQAHRSIYEVLGGKFTLTRFEPNPKTGRKLVRHMYKKGERFTAYNYEVPTGFMDLLKVVGPALDEELPVPPPTSEVPTEDHTGKVGKESRTPPEEGITVTADKPPDVDIGVTVEEKAPPEDPPPPPPTTAPVFSRRK